MSVPNLQTYKVPSTTLHKLEWSCFCSCILLLASVAPLAILRRPPSDTRVRMARRAIEKTSGVRQSTYGGGIVECHIVVRSTATPSPKLYNTLRYSEQVIINTSDSLNGCGSYLFQANNLYDPNYTGTGHQPLYYDQLTGIYNHWTVISSKMTIVVQRVSNPVQVQCVLLLDDDASLGTSNNINLLTERAGAVFGAADPGNGLLLTLSKTWSARKWFGANPLDNDNLQGTVSAGPSEGVYYGFMVQDLTGTSQSVACHVTMEFNVIWDELASVASS